MNTQAFKTAGFGEQFGKRLVTGLAAGAATAVMRGGKVAVQQIAVDAFGNALGSSLADSMSGAGQPELTTGDFARMDGAGYRGAAYEVPNAGNGLQLGRGGYGLAVSRSAVDDWSNEISGGSTLLAGRDAQIDAMQAAEAAELRRLAQQRSAQAATAVTNPASNMDVRDIRATNAYQMMRSRQISEGDSAIAARGYPEMRAAAAPTARETAVNWVSSVVGTSRAGGVVTGAFDGWLAAPDSLSRLSLSKLPDAIGAIPSAAMRVVDGARSYVGQLLDDPLGTAANTMAGGVDSFRSGYRTLNSNDRAMGSSLFALGTAAIPMGRLDAAGSTVTVYRVEGSIAPNQRLLINEAGHVSLVSGNENMIWLNFGQEARGTEYLQRKIDAGLPGAQLKSFEVDAGILDRIRVDAVPERFARQNPNRPIISADPYPDQFGLPKSYFDELLKSIKQGTGRNGQ